MSSSINFLFSLALLFLLSSCGGSDDAPSGTTTNCNNTPCANEPSICSTINSFSPSVTITGSAVYKRRLYLSSGLGGVDSNDYPIRYAEIAVLDSTGSEIQCGETDASGNFSISVPESSSANYRIQVRSRISNSSQALVSVLDRHDNMTYYAVQSASFTPDSNRSVGTLIAAHDGQVIGGAFFILDHILRTNEFLRAQTTSCDGSSGSITACSPFTVAPKVQVLWRPGFNPGDYYGVGPVSFYISGTSRLYILGGDNNDVNSSDTDHFDSTVVIHEYGHFLEDMYPGSSSPGGAHDANSILDARLAWSEGFATFLALQVTADSNYTSVFDNDTANYLNQYVDTYGNSDGSTGNEFPKINLETNSPRRDPSSTSYSIDDGEGIFREFSVVRGLIDAMDSDVDAVVSTNPGSGENIDSDFHEFWTVFASSDGINALNFINMGQFLQIQDGLTGRTDWDSIRLDESMTASGGVSNPNQFLRYYATPDVGNGCSDTATIQPSSDNSNSENGSFANSNQLASNDFYAYTHPGGSLEILLNGNTTLDLDLFLYANAYTYGSSSTMLGSSLQENTSSETISISNLAAGTYMINVMVFTGNLAGTPEPWPSSGYDLTITNSSGSNKICPP